MDATTLMLVLKLADTIGTLLGNLAKSTDLQKAVDDAHAAGEVIDAAAVKVAVDKMNAAGADFASAIAAAQGGSQPSV